MRRPRCPGARPARAASAGFTLLEAVMVIVVTGIVAVSSSMFIAGPVKNYFDTVRRAMLVDTADTALRRFARDIENAVPNSIRLTQSGGATFVELIPAVSAGHYRSIADPSGTGAVFDPGNATGNAFEIIGPYDVPPSGAQLVIFNLGPGVTSSDAYAGSNRRTIVSLVSNTLSYSLTGGQFPYASPSDRYYVVSGAQSYVCDPVAHTLARYSGYAIQSTQPSSVSAAPLSAATKGVLANYVTSCSVALSQAMQSRNLVTLGLTLTSQAESVNFYQEVHAPNVP
jgi:MSHA biogenesis protein MshO